MTNRSRKAVSPLSRVRAVVIDDNESTRIVLRNVLRQAEVQTLADASCGETGLALVERHVPDLVCLDVMMPGMDGLEVLAKIREQFPDMRVLMVTGQSDLDTVKQMIESGASGIIIKPFNPARVFDTLHKVFGIEH